MTVKIVLPKSEDGKATPVIGTKIIAENGAEIKDVIGLDIHTDIGGLVTATIDVLVEDIDGMDSVHAILGTETIKQIALMHGCELTKKSSIRLGDGVLNYKNPSHGLASVDFKVDCSELDEIQRVLDALDKYSDELPQAMKDELAEIIKEK